MVLIPTYYILKDKRNSVTNCLISVGLLCRFVAFYCFALITFFLVGFYVAPTRQKSTGDFPALLVEEDLRRPSWQYFMSEHHHSVEPSTFHKLAEQLPHVKESKLPGGMGFEPQWREASDDVNVSNHSATDPNHYSRVFLTVYITWHLLEVFLPLNIYNVHEI